MAIGIEGTSNSPMTSKKNKRPQCFAKLDTVFPMGKEGLRTTPDTCLACFHKTDCLRTAIRGKDGLNFREECIDRAYRSGMIGFFERWSKKKAINRQK